MNSIKEQVNDAVERIYGAVLSINNCSGDIAPDEQCIYDEAINNLANILENMSKRNVIKQEYVKTKIYIYTTYENDITHYWMEASKEKGDSTYAIATSHLYWHYGAGEKYSLRHLIDHSEALRFMYMLCDNSGINEIGYNDNGYAYFINKRTGERLEYITLEDL